MLSTDEKSQLKSSSDERVSDNNQHQVEVDLFNKTCLNDDNHLPKFSIRDYVFATRDKDIETHWPFSSKNLQLCLKHGVEDVLPPFQTLECVRNPISTPKCAARNVGSVSTDVCQKQASDIENNKSSSSVKISEVVAPSSNKVVTDTQNPVKKCRLIVKLSNFAEPKSKEDTITTMSSKVCPVCKKFTSSSNTTLNAHIDRCLSEESNVKMTAGDTRVIKHRIKPRKTRLMVDIYATALISTLEDLDRRNGTNWTTQVSAEEKNNAYSSVNSEDSTNDEEGAVYYDSNGTKLRILSKFSDLQSDSNAKDDCGRRKLVERDKGSKFVSTKKNKYLARRNKIMISCSPGLDNCPKVNNGEERKYPSEEEEDLGQPLEVGDQLKSDDFGMIKQWVGSKRSGLKQKINAEHENQHQDIIIKDLRSVKSKLPFVGDKFFKRNSNSNSHKSDEDFSLNSHDEYAEQLFLRKRARVSLLESRNSDHGKKTHAASPHCKKTRSIGPRIVNSDDSSFIRSRMSKHHILSTGINENGSLKKPSLDNVPSSGGKKLSSLRKNILSVRHNASVSESNKKLQRKQLGLKKPRQYYTSGLDEEAVEELGKNAAQTEKSPSKSSIDKSRVSTIQSGSSDATTESNIAGGNVPAGTSDPVKEVENEDEFVCEPANPNNISGGEALISFGESLTSSDFLQINADEGRGIYFADVDPIPIPGPPGSFLPSPDRMPSIELQANSSLTTCRVHSSEDEHGLVDNMDSSDSPISATTPFDQRIGSSKLDDESSRTNSVFPGMSRGRFGNCQPCCCSRKEGVLQSDPNYNELQGSNLRSQTTPSSTSNNPVLRLMGKNLMVVNKEENISPQTRPTDSSMVNSWIEHRPHHNALSRCPPIFVDNMQKHLPLQHFDYFTSSNGSRFLNNLGTPEYSPHPSRYNFTPDRLDTRMRSSYEVEKAQKHKEVTIIDDLPENESRINNVDPFYGYQNRCYPIHSAGSRIVRNANYTQTELCEGMSHRNSVNWNHSSPNFLTASSASAGHDLRSSMYFSSGFSSLPTNFT